MLKKFFHYVPLPWILVFLLIAIFFSFSFSPNPDQAKVINEDTSGFPQFYMKNVLAREYDETGALRYQLSTPAISHFQLNLNTPGPDDYTLLEKPSMIFRQAGEAPWTIESNQGRSDNNGELIILTDKVLIEQNSDEQGLVQVRTETLLARPKQQFVETDKAVKITAEHTQIDAIGMSADLATSRLQLNTRVDAVYEPHE